MAEADPFPERPGRVWRIKIGLLMGLLRPLMWVMQRVDQASVPKVVPPPGPPPGEADMARIAETYFGYHKYLAEGARGIEPPEDMLELSGDLLDMARDDPERLWPIMIALVDRAPSNEILMWIAAGLVEDTVTWHGRRFLDRLEQRAVVSKNFHAALRGIWGWERFPKEVRERLFAVLTPDWEELASKRSLA